MSIEPEPEPEPERDLLQEMLDSLPQCNAEDQAMIDELAHALAEAIILSIE
jgi:hypothetical protein